MKRFVLRFVPLLILCSLLVTLPKISIAKAEPKTIVVPDDYSTIQSAIDAASEGDIVFVKSGTYNESVSIDISISLIGEDPATTTIIGDWRLNGTVVLIRHNDVNITDFTIQPSAYSVSRRGVHLLHVNHCNVFGNVFLKNGRGVWLYGSSENNITGNTIDGPGIVSCGILVDYSSNNWICGNIVKDNDFGVSFTSSPDNTLYNNTIIDNQNTGLNIASDRNKIIENIIEHNQVYGIRLSGSNNILKGNKMSNNTSNFCFGWEYACMHWDTSKFVNNIDTSNDAEGKPIIYWVNEQDRKVPENVAFVALINCSNIIVENLNLSKNGQGIFVVSTINSHITQNSIQVPDEGVLIHNSFGITITDNTIINGGTGIHLVSSSKNTITNNVMINGGHGIHLIFSSENTITNNTITKWVKGIILDASNESIINRNIISGGSFGGIDLDGSKRNIISINEIADCSELALMFWNNASENLFYLNSFIGNARNVEEYYPGLPGFPVNIWDNGTVGNFWSDYYGTDNNGDGIGDTPYVIDENNQDNYPLMHPLVAPPPLDTTTPAISIVSPENKTYTVNNVSLTCTVSEPTFWMRYSLDGQANVTVAGNTTLTGLSDGTHSLTVYASDLFGNIGSSSKVYFTIDAPPSISILSPENKTYETTDIPLTFTVDETTSWMGFSLDGQANVTITGNSTLIGLSEGSHSLVVYARDVAGNHGASEIIYFSVEAKKAESFPTLTVAAIVIMAVVGAAFLVYFREIKKKGN